MKHESLSICDTEEEFFQQISPIIMKQYEHEKIITPLYKDHIYEKRSPIIVFINVSVPYNDELFNYREFTKWFIKTNFKYTFYKYAKPHNPITLYIDNIFINQYYISNDIAEIPNTTIPNNLFRQIIHHLVFFILSFFYDKTKKVYITAQFIMREPPIMTLPLNNIEI